MFTEHNSRSYLANPANQAAVRLVRLRGAWANRKSFAFLSNCLGAAGLIGSVLVLIYWWTTPTSWYGYYDYGLSAWTGIVLCVVGLAMTAGIWKGVRVLDEWDQAESVSQLVRKGEVIEVPTEISSAVDSLLSKAGLSTFARACYAATPEDFEIVRRVSRAVREGHSSSEFRQGHIDPLLGEIVARIQKSYDEAHQQHEQRLTALRRHDDQVGG